MQMPKILLNPSVRWACQTHHADQIGFVEGLGQSLHALPEVGMEITAEFIVVPGTRTPLPVKVTNVTQQQGPTGDVLTVVVAPVRPRNGAR